MKKLLMISLGMIFLSTFAFCQKLKDKEKDKLATEELIIRNKGARDSKFTVEINGDKVTINGKPLSEFKDDNITINRRKITVWDKSGFKTFEMPSSEFLNGFKYWNNGENPPSPFFGVSTEEADGGSRITEITKSSAAEKGGFKVGDIITKVNDKVISNPEDLSEAIQSFKPKDEITVYYKRDGKENSSKVILGQNKSSNEMTYSFSSPRGGLRSFASPRSPESDLINSLPKVQTWNNDDLFENGSRPFIPGSLFPRHQRLGLKIQDTEEANGVKVLSIEKESAAEKAGLLHDDIITEIGGVKVMNTDEAREQLQNNNEKSSFPVKIKRGDKEMKIDIKIPKKLNTVNL